MDINAHRLLGLAVLTGVLTNPASAQSPADTRPATTTVNGDSGLWFVPTGETLAAHTWAVSAYRVDLNYEQGFTDVSMWPLTWAAGLRDRLELFSAFTLVTRIDRDVRPLFLPVSGSAGTAIGGLVNDYPFVQSG